MKIFMIQGALAGIAGTLAGVGVGVLISVNIDVIVPFTSGFSVSSFSRKAFT